MKRRILALLCAVALAISDSGCVTTKDIPEVVSNAPGHEKWEDPVDYSVANNWLHVPEKIDKEVDVIYYYPTCYTPADASVEVVADIDDESMRSKAQGVYASQATVFEDSCNVFAPFYRQVSGDYGLNLSSEETEKLLAYESSKDPENAINYYFENYNNGRPFILAGHSQGAQVVVSLLSDYLKEHPEYLDRMVAAYAIGCSVTNKYLEDNPQLKFAEGANDTGVIVSWNTEGPENIGQYNVCVTEGAKAINPINWKTDDTYAPAEDNLGAFINGEELQGIADAKVDTERGSVITNADKKYALPANDLMGPASFHGNDYGLYYNNIAQLTAAIKILNFDKKESSNR